MELSAKCIMDKFNGIYENFSNVNSWIMDGFLGKLHEQVNLLFKHDQRSNEKVYVTQKLTEKLN